MTKHSALIIDDSLLLKIDDAGIALLTRMNVASVSVVGITSADLNLHEIADLDAKKQLQKLPLNVQWFSAPIKWKAVTLLRAIASVSANPLDSWLICSDPHAVAAAGQAGLAGVVLIGVNVPAEDHGLVVARAESLADAPRVMVPRDGGCWHDRQ